MSQKPNSSGRKKASDSMTAKTTSMTSRITSMEAKTTTISTPTAITGSAAAVVTPDQPTPAKPTRVNRLITRDVDARRLAMLSEIRDLYPT